MPLKGLDQPAPFRISVYDKAFGFLFRLGDASVSVTLRHLALGTGSITVPLTHKRIDALLTPGTRVVIDYMVGSTPSDDASWAHAMSGFLTSIQIPQTSTPSVGKTVTFGIVDDYWLLMWMLLWANPAAGIGSQTANAYDARSGSGESVIKAYVTANANRLSIPLTCATNHNRGATVKGNFRFDNANDVLPGLAQAAGLGISVQQVGTGCVLDVYEPTDRTARVLSEASGTITSWSLNSTFPSSTRAIVAAQGAGTARSFSQVTDGTGLEALYGVKLETFVDARDTADSTTLAQRGAAALAAGVPQAGYSVTVAETPQVRAFKNLFVGDLIAVEVTASLALSDVLTAMTLTWDGDGLHVTPQVGQANATANPNAVLAQAISKVGAGLRYLRSSL